MNPNKTAESQTYSVRTPTTFFATTIKISLSIRLRFLLRQATSLSRREDTGGKSQITEGWPEKREYAERENTGLCIWYRIGWKVRRMVGVGEKDDGSWGEDIFSGEKIRSSDEKIWSSGENIFGKFYRNKSFFLAIPLRCSLQMCVLVYIIHVCYLGLVSVKIKWWWLFKSVFLMIFNWWFYLRFEKNFFLDFLSGFLLFRVRFFAFVFCFSFYRLFLLRSLPF